MEPKIIKTEKQYEKAFAEVERLITLDPKTGTPEADKLDLLALLVENYEKEKFPFDLPSPIDAIKFRMEEAGLKQKDLVQYIGSKSKVSEVLSGKRPLTLQMVRSLHNGLDISAEVLLQDIQPHANKQSLEIKWEDFPLREMVKRKWITTRFRNLHDHSKELMEQFLAPLGGELPSTAICRRTIHKRSEKQMDLNALQAWTARVLIKATEEGFSSEYKPGIITKPFLNKVAHLSFYNQGPLLAKELLNKNGIALIIEPHLPKTLLDGGSMLSDTGNPVIGLTIRHDRIDNFWYTLIHELSHVSKHLKNPEEVFIDDIYAEDANDPKEKEADKMTRETFIPRSVWTRSDAYLKRNEKSIIKLAKDLEIHPAIVAGRLRWDTRNYYIFSNLLGKHEVKKLFIKE